MKSKYLTPGVALGLFLCAVLSLFFLIRWTITTSQQWHYAPLPSHILLTLSGENVKIPNYFHARNYLLVFFTETSPSSLSQLQELSKAAPNFPPNLAAILIHPGKIQYGLPAGTSNKLHLLIDPSGDFASNLQIRTVPTTIIMTGNNCRVFFSEKLLPAKEILHHIANLDNNR